MPDPIEDKDKKDPDKPPAMQEGPRDVATIQSEIAKAALAGQPVDELAKELALALVAAGSAAGSPASVPPPEPPTMGMKPEDAYARARAEMAQERKEAIDAIIDANHHLTDAQKAMARKQTSVKDARELIATYPRAANQNELARMGMQGNPKTDPKGKQSVRERALSADDDVMARVSRASSKEDTAGLLLDIPGHSVGWSPTQWLKEELGKHERRMKAQQEAGQ
jgi:hypothetical protein